MTPEMKQQIHTYWDEDKHDKIIQMIMEVPEEDRDIEMLGQLIVAEWLKRARYIDCQKIFMKS